MGNGPFGPNRPNIRTCRRGRLSPRPTPNDATAAGPQQLKCGETISTDTTLHNDLVNCPNNGIIIDADNVTLDLNGHTIDGDGAAAAGCDPAADFCDTGVVAFDHDGVTVMHGSLRQFGGGVNFGQVRRTRLLDLSASGNADATRMPARMHGQYLRRLFLDDDLSEGRFPVHGRPVSLGDIATPTFCVATDEEIVSTVKRTLFEALSVKASAGSFDCARRKISRAESFSSANSADSSSGDAVIDGTSGIQRLIVGRELLGHAAFI